MNREEQKATYERKVFEKFLNLSLVEMDRTSIRAGNADNKEPDMVCRSKQGKMVGFELGRITDPNLAEVVNQWSPENSQYVRTTDPSPKIARKKIGKKYEVTYPVQLILYSEQPLVTPDDVIIPSIEAICHTHHSYSKVWYMGTEVSLLYETAHK